MRITVIGGSGTTGSAAVAEAARRGHTVTSVTRSGRHVEGAAADVIAELADAARSIAEGVASGRLSPRGVTEKTLARHLYLPDVPDVDLMIRTSGEQRLSNYLLWQMAYAEMMFVDTPWPAFDREELWGCLEEYAGRDRRFGGAIDRVSQA